MKKLLMIFIVTVIPALVFNALAAAEHPTSTKMQMGPPPGESGLTGEELFDRNCAVCHRGGGNIINTRKDLHKEDRDEFGIRTPEDIIKIMRKPGPGMSIFDEHTIPDKDAKKIAEYILETF